MKSDRKLRHGQVTRFNSKVVRDLNRSVILNLIREHQPISRVRIAQMTNLNKSTVSSIVGSLLTEQLLEERLEKRGSVGRNPVNLRLKKGNHFFGAIYFDSVSTRVAIIDIDGTIKETLDIRTEASHPERFIARCLSELNGLRKQNQLPPFKGIGATVAGIVDTAQSKVVFAPNLGWDDLDLSKTIRECCPEVPTIALENDAKASAIAELWFGRHDIGLSNFVFLLVDRGIGAAVVVDRRVLYGESHAAGEFGHTTLIEGGEPCTCGNTGCWEMYASDRATVKRYILAKRLNGDSAVRLSMDDVIEAAVNGDENAREGLVECGYYLGLGIANIIKSVDPSAIIIGGRITRAWDLVYPEIQSVLTKRSFFGKTGATSILPTSLSSISPLLGAAALSIRRFFAEYGVTL
jgi:predicted NBD/HSP70 family sugar kinase